MSKKLSAHKKNGSPDYGPPSGDSSLNGAVLAPGEAATLRRAQHGEGTPKGRVALIGSYRVSHVRVRKK